MALAPPAAVQMRMDHDGFGPGEQLYRLYPAGTNETIVALAMCIDVTKASHPLLRWLSKNAPDFRQSWNLGYGVMALRGLDEVASKRAGVRIQRPSGHAGSGPLKMLTDSEVTALRPLLDQGRVGLIESDDRGRIAQASVVERVNAPPSKLQRALSRPGEWQDFVSALKVTKDRPIKGGRAFTLGFSFPAFSVSAEMEMQTLPNGCDLRSHTGRLHRSLLSFRHSPDGSGTVLTSTARLRMRQGGLILRELLDGDPNFGHALNAGILMAFSRSFKQRAEGRR
jgi:hypothetical protein